jgi:hypothetical protein
MSKVAIAGDPLGTGTFTIQSPNSNTDRTLVLPDNAGTVLVGDAVTGRLPAANAPSGSVIQVVQAVKTDTFTSALASFVDVTGLAVSITPSSATSKILVSCAVAVGYNNDGTVSRRGGISLFRGTTNLLAPTSPGSRSPSYAWAPEMISNEVYLTYCFEFLDSPNSTSPLSYNIKVLNGGAGSSIVYVNRSEEDGNASTTGRGVSTITVMEIAA